MIRFTQFIRYYNHNTIKRQLQIIGNKNENHSLKILKKRYNDLLIDYNKLKKENNKLKKENNKLKF